MSRQHDARTREGAVPSEPPAQPDMLSEIAARTLGYYDASAESFWHGTRDHDVRQNYEALLGNLRGTAPYAILDLGCGPGRDVRHFRSLGHDVVGLDGAMRFVEMARELSGCEVLHQDFLALDLPASRFDGVFANASLFHVPSQAITRVLRQLRATLRPDGVLFVSNPRGNDEEGWRGDRYGCFYALETWRRLVTDAGFAEIEHYYRPTGKPLAEQPWLATVWRRQDDGEQIDRR